MRCCPSAAACTSRGCCNDPLHQPRPNANPDPDRGGTGAPAHADARGTRRLAGRRWARLLAYLGVLGPGLIASQAGNDAGGIATYSSAGSQFGYRMLFFMLLVAIGLVLVQEMAARLGTFALGCLLVANLGLVVSEFGGIGAAMELFGISRYLSVPVAAAIVWGLVVLGSYRYAERLFLLMALVFFTYPIAAFLAHPNWSQVAANTLVPHLLATKAFLLLGVAIIGTTISPYMQLYQAAAVADKGITPEQYLIPPGFCGGSIAWKAGWSHGTQLEFPPGPEALPARA